MIKDFVCLNDFSAQQLKNLLAKAIEDKKLLRADKLPATCERKTLAMFFEKPSLRTRVSFETAMTQLGGHAIYLTQSDIGLGSREPVQDVARVLGRMCDGIMARTFSHDTVVDLAKYAPSPVINALSDFSHPCQAMADIMTAQEHFGSVEGKTLVFIGDGNNVARSLAIACGKLGMKFILACPEDYNFEAEFIENSTKQFGSQFEISHDPKQAVASADVIYTDTWVSMGQEDEKQKRINDFKGFSVDEELMKLAPAHAIVMHCLPAYRGLEISEGVFEQHAETIMEEAENRLHFQRALVDVLINKKEF